KQPANPACMAAVQGTAAKRKELKYVELSGQVVMKVLQHCNDASPQVTTGQLLGLDVGSTLEVTDCFPFPASTGDELEEDSVGVYQLEIMRCLREVNVDNNTVGWYQSAVLGTYQTSDLIDTFINYHDNIKNCVCLIYDPQSSQRGSLALQAIRLKDSFIELYKQDKLTAKDMVQSGVSWRDVFVDIPIKIANLALTQALITELQSDGLGTAADYDRLSLSTQPYVEKSIQSLLDQVDDLIGEQQKVTMYHKNVARHAQSYASWLAKRRQDNVTRRAAGEEALPEDDPAEFHKEFKPPVEPSLLDSYLICSQMSTLCDQLNVTGNATLEKLYVMDALQKAITTICYRDCTASFSVLKELAALKRRPAAMANQAVIWKDYVESGAVPLDNFILSEAPEPEVPEDGAVIELIYCSVDPYMRGRCRAAYKADAPEGRMRNSAGYFVGPFAPGEPLASGALAKVVSSKTPQLKEGSIVAGSFSWVQRQALSAEQVKGVQVISPELLATMNNPPLTLFMGALGMTGMTAYCSLERIGKPKAGETVFVSGAAGAVGIIVGQLCKNVYGCKVVGSAGSPEKIELLKQYGYDSAFNYKTTSPQAGLAEHCPNGIDVYYDNVGGEMLEAALDVCNVNARVVACGSISQYNAQGEARYGVKNLFNITTKRILMQGFIVFDFNDMRAEFESKMAEYVASGKVRDLVHVQDGGLAQAGKAFVDMMALRISKLLHSHQVPVVAAPELVARLMCKGTGKRSQSWQDAGELRPGAWQVLEKDMAEVSMQRHGRAKQLVVFFGAASIGNGGGWGADAVLLACCKVVCRPRGTDQRRGRVVLVDEHRTTGVSSAVNGKQPCEEELDHEQATRRANWKPPAGRWTCACCAQPGANSSIEAEQAAEPSQPTKGTGKAQGKAAKAKPAPQPGRWLDRDYNAALNMQRIGESSIRCCPTVPAQPSPAQPSPAQPSPAQPSPAQPSPAQPSPAQPSPAQPSPAQPSPAQPSPAQPSPAQPSPAQPSPAQPSPAQPSPAQPSPAQPSPAQPSPAQPSPAQPSPAQPSPAQPSPALT
ncbi:hypothetical protein QJQ45_021225, partial [Haematococcus lacustris]